MVHISQTNANFHLFYKKVMCVSNREKDKIENVLLEGTEIDDNNINEYESTMTRLENLESGITGNDDCPVVSTDVGLKLIENNITEINVFESEHDIENVLNNFLEANGPVDNSNKLMALISEAFISFIPELSNNADGIRRLRNEKAQTFYAMFLDWHMKHIPISLMIKKMLKYWDALPLDRPVFVGSWGDTSIGDSFLEYHTYVHKKTLGEKVNLAIVRIKEEEDFFDYVIFRFIDILNDLEILDETFYKLAKYGTADRNIIALIRNGFSRGVSELLLSDYSEFIMINKEDDCVNFRPGLYDRLVEDQVGYLQKYEVALNVTGNKGEEN